MTAVALGQRYKAIEQRVHKRLFISVGLLLALIAPPLCSLLIQLNDQMQTSSLERHRLRAEKVGDSIVREAATTVRLDTLASERFYNSLLSEHGRLLLSKDGQTTLRLEPKIKHSEPPFLGGQYELPLQVTEDVPGTAIYRRDFTSAGHAYRIAYFADSIPFSAVDRLTRLDLLNFAFCFLFGLILIYWSHRSSLALARAQHELALSIAHEIRTPLAGMRLYAEMLEDGIAEDPQQSARYGKLLSEGSAKLSAVVDRLLSPETTVSCKAHALPSVLQELRRELSAFYTERGIELTVTDNVGDGASIRCDLESLRQIFLIFADNSIKHGGAASHRPVTLGTRLRRGVWRPKVELYLQDAGNVRKAASPQGNGLGLKIALALARASGGGILLKRERGKTTAVVRLKLCR